MQAMLGNHPGVRGTTPGEWKAGALNPDWVEHLMGFPSGWTDLNTSATQTDSERPESQPEKTDAPKD
jgi:hypothetical protein